jgi:hypothetical protein
MSEHTPKPSLPPLESAFPDALSAASFLTKRAAAAPGLDRALRVWVDEPTAETTHGLRQAALRFFDDKTVASSSPGGSTSTADIKPAHPLVIDAHTRLARYATQNDIRRMEAICNAYDLLLEDVRNLVGRAEALAARPLQGQDSQL